MNLPVDLAQLLLAATGHAAPAHGVVTLVPQRHDWLYLIPLFPLVGFVLNALFGTRIQRALGKRAVHAISIGAVSASWLVAVACFVSMVGQPAETRFFRQVLWNVLDTGNGFRLDLAFSLDPLSMMMTLIILTIGTLIHVYSTGYMGKEKAYWRFFAYLNLFVFAMLLLVMGENLAVMFFGWEGVGLASYLLIAFWYEDVDKAKAGMKAFVVNRIGDFGFLVGMFALFWALAGSFGPVPGAFPTLSFHELRDQFTTGGVGEALAAIRLWNIHILAVIGVGLFIGATGKSAQLPLYVWLPDAMAGPTPVSALIHAATMVTAGVYMIGRMNFVFALSPETMTIIAVVAALTAFFAATIGFFQHDIKKVLAYSTVSQLGFMFIGVGVGAYWTGLYHLLTHAFFKATLFLASGAVIYGCHHNQDMLKMGGLKKVQPITEKAYLYACVCISAAPIFFLGNGFFSKDEILWNAFRAGGNLLIPGWIIWLVGWVSAAGTAFYMWRSYYMTFTGTYRGDLAHAAADAHGHAAHAVDPHHPVDPDAHHVSHADEDEDDKAHDHHGGPPINAPRSMTWVLAALSVGSFLSIGLGFWAPLGHLLHWSTISTPALEHWLSPALPAAAITAARQVPYGAGVEWTLIFASVAVALGGWALARALYKDAKSTTPARLLEAWPKLHHVVYNKYFVDEIYAKTVLAGVAWLREALAWFDQTILDGIVNGVGSLGRALAVIEGAVDKYVVDGLVNLVGRLVLGFGQQVRALQTGRLQTYLYGILAGTLLVIGVTYLLDGGADVIAFALRALF